MSKTLGFDLRGRPESLERVLGEMMSVNIYRHRLKISLNALAVRTRARSAF